ncbi:MAG TPA: glycosyltransferase 87 family protein [Anaerolineales bacterium]|nr:glycosyltransferase 87 family protein [Anaerolineales bacterium]
MFLNDRRPAARALILWSMLTALLAASILFIFLHWGGAGFKIFLQQWPLEDLRITLASVTFAWLLLGALIYLLYARRVNARNAWGIAGFFLIGFIYLNLLSERFRYGDYQYYLEAASNLLQHKPLPPTYLYPPLWATLLQFLVPSGEENSLLILWAANFISLMAFYVLLQRVLEHYGFSTRLAALVTTLFMLINAPVLRTLFYVQINLHTLNFILLSLLLYPKRPFLSALALALAVHLKSSPIVLALAFLLELDWRWLGWFVVSLVLVAMFTVAIDGIYPFLDFIKTTQGLTALQTTNFHDTSFDSFFRSIVPLLHLDLIWASVLTYASKALLLTAALLVTLRAAGRAIFFDGKGKGARLANALPPLFILMTLASPVVWEHHGIFVALSFLLLLKRLETPDEWIWFGLAYILEFILPTFDFLPWSYGRLLAPLIVLWLIWRATGKQGRSRIFASLNDWMDKLPALGI